MGVIIMRQAIKALLLWLLLTGHAFAYVHTNGCVASTGSTTQISISCTATNGTIPSATVISGEVAWDNASGQTLVSVKDDQNNLYTVVDTLAALGGFPYIVSSFYRTNVTNSPQIITATFSAAAPFLNLVLDTNTGSSGILNSHSMAAQSSPTGSNSVTSGTLTTSSGSLIYGAITSGGFDSSPTLGTGFSLDQSLTTSGNDFSYSEQMVASSTSAAATLTPSTADSWVTGGMAFNTAISSGSLPLMGCCQ